MCKKTILALIILLSLLFIFPSIILSQQVILSFDDGFLGDQDGNGCVACTNTSTLGVTNLRFGQASNTGNFAAQGNDIIGFVKFKDVNGIEYQINGNIQYRITSGSTLRAFGFVPTNTNPVTIATNTTTTTPSGTFEIIGINQTNSSTFGFIAEGQMITLNNGSIRGNAATSGLVDQLNTYLASQINISVTGITVNEGDGTATVTVSINSAPSEIITVDYITQDSTAIEGSDYTSANGTLTFPASSSSSQTFTIPITDDSIVEESEFIKILLSNPTGGAGITNNTAVVTVLDNDSVQDENLVLNITQRNCWRFLSSPLQNLTYNTIIEPFWTQGVTGSDSAPPGTDANLSNIFIWDKTTTENSPSGWITTGLDLNNVVPEGEGFLMSFFEDDNFDGIIQPGEQFDKQTTVSGTAHPFDATISPSMNPNPDGWTLVGNPFNDAIDFGYLTANGLTTDLTDVAYVYNINAAGSNPNTNGNPGGWVSTNGSIGDLHDGKIAVFQGFLVQNTSSATNPEITFNNASRTTGATFYGKENRQHQNYVRFELNGDRVQNSAWLSFSENASAEKMKGDAYELVPFKDDYALLASKKGEELFDIGQFPVQPTTEIPLHIETTVSGAYSISATDLNTSPGLKLIFKDNQEGISIPVDENFHYQFFIDQASKALNGNTHLTCRSTGDELVKAFTPNPAKIATGVNNRFSIYITDKNEPGFEIPAKVGLSQNYPNPFNPTTIISYQLPASSDVLLEVYDLVGRKVATLVNGPMQAGIHSVDFNAGTLSSGVYIYRLQTGNKTLSRKLTVIK
ncbi:Calx-beta domain-containing protein [Rhodohalobacter sp. 614A]|uniref:Calx-beta domain-containing protein n=1 Tax=Rhodohalobacter sp. 614A TaxID=2908649 RepID=UPI001F164AF7|nr:Calx-beta domain-containing protein [Rhodohalobacter sp. 614A]